MVYRASQANQSRIIPISLKPLVLQLLDEMGLSVILWQSSLRLWKAYNASKLSKVKHMLAPTQSTQHTSNDALMYVFVSENAYCAGCLVQIIADVVEYLLKAPLKALLWASGKPYKSKKQVQDIEAQHT